MADFTSCPACRKPLVVPNPASCSCGAPLGTGSRERTTPADPVEAQPQEKELLTVAAQGEASIALLEQWNSAGAFDLFGLTQHARPMKDSDLCLTPGTLGRELAAKLKQSPEIFADVPQLVGMLTLTEKAEPATCSERIEQLTQLTALARLAAASPAARSIILPLSDRMLDPGHFLRRTERVKGEPERELLVWVHFSTAEGQVHTYGLYAFGLPELKYAFASRESESDAVNAVSAMACEMLKRKAAFAEGHVFQGQGSTSYELRADHGRLLVSAQRRPN